MASWLSDVIQSLNDLGGLGHYSDIYQRVRELRNDTLPKNWQAIIRKTIETNSSDSDAYDNRHDNFYTVNGKGKGVWGLRDYTPNKSNLDVTGDDLSFPEGKKLLRQHILRERNPRLVIEAKSRFLSLNGSLYCEVCELNFENVYGDIGKDFIEAHHIKPVSELQANEKTNVNDLVMVCSNCHSMLHRKRPWLTKDDLKRLIR